MIYGQIRKILTLKDNDWGRFELDCAGKKVIAVGIISDASVGMSVSLEGFEEVNKYGRQFKIQTVLSAEEDPFSGIRAFYSGGYIKGIGPVKANAIVSAFGKEAVDILDTEEGRARLAEINGFSMSMIDKMLPSYLENRKYKDIIIFLNGLASQKQVEQIYDMYGEKAVSLLKRNPYRLQIDIDGFGFKKTDRMAMAAGIKPDSEDRLIAASKYVLEEAAISEGHCYLDFGDIISRVLLLLAPAPKSTDKTITDRIVENAYLEWTAKKEEFIKRHNPSGSLIASINEAYETREIINAELGEALNKAVESGVLINHSGHYYTKKMFSLEQKAAQNVAFLRKSVPIRTISDHDIEAAIRETEKRKGSGFAITDEQRQAVNIGLKNRISVISGGPGRGKTAISEIIALAYVNAGFAKDPGDIIMLAPTGRAAQRITESTGYPAMTIHRAILKAERSGEYPKGKLILCDESSMVDIFLFEKLLKYAINCQIIFVGDVDQIASVGPGKVLADLINSGEIPCILLKKGHRNSGAIAENASLINAGVKMRNYIYGDSFVYTGKYNPEGSQEQIDAYWNNFVGTMLNDYVMKINQYGIENVMLCTAMKDRGPVAVNKLNKLLQERLTKGQPEAKFGSSVFRVGDRVMQTRNNYKFRLIRDNAETLGIFNGERGTVAKITKGINENGEPEQRLIVLFDDGSMGGYTPNTVPDLSLAYVTTLHKCQGSECDCMMMAYTYGDYILLNRSLFYTGETRAKKEFRFYGEEKNRYGKTLSAFDIAVGKTDDNQRNTGLSSMIKEQLYSIDKEGAA